MAIRTLASVEYVKSYFREVSLAVALAIIGTLLVSYDRRPPFTYISTDISPPIVMPGQSITIRRHVDWHRQCEGIAFTEIVSFSDHIVTNYDPGTRYPSELGDTYADRSIALPLTMRSGHAIYRGVIQFRTCGITSRIWPIDVPYQERTFEVR